MAGQSSQLTRAEVIKMSKAPDHSPKKTGGSGSGMPEMCKKKGMAK